MSTENGLPSKVYNNVYELVGNTPIVKLNKVPKLHGVACEIYAKCEFLNPGGSIKDRIALTMIDLAKKEGIVNEKTEFVEPSSGNTGIAIALTASVMGNKSIIVTEEKNSGEKVGTLNLLGAEVIQTKTKEEELEICRRLKEENPDIVVMLDQFNNKVNPKTHFDFTAEEIIAAVEDIDMLVLGAGTGGTISGVGRKLKEKNSNCLVVAAEPCGSTMINKKGADHSFEIEGIGGSDVPGVLDVAVVDSFEVVTDEEAFLMARDLAKIEGLLCGGSSGAILAAAIKAIKRHNFVAGKRVVVILPDGIRNYMSKFVCAQWMEARGFMEPPEHTMEWWNHPISKLELKQIYPKVTDSSSCEEVIDTMKRNNVNLAIVVDSFGHYVGAVSKDNLRHRATNPTRLPGQACLEFNFKDPITDHLDTHAYKLAQNPKKKGKEPTIGLLSRILDITPYVIVGVEGHDVNDFFLPGGVATANEVFDYIRLYTK